ncbi:MAG: abortive infection family protein [Dehalococcoidia bacterium]|nr:abortive infection family protein [Dehalococcoidia bacterium]
MVEGVGAMRNKLSDAHGKGMNSPVPDDRHAELAVILAGAIALFLVKTWKETKQP